MNEKKIPTLFLKAVKYTAYPTKKLFVSKQEARALLFACWMENNMSTL